VVEVGDGDDLAVRDAVHGGELGADRDEQADRSPRWS
jgi:hypothetical protein